MYMYLQAFELMVQITYSEWPPILTHHKITCTHIVARSNFSDDHKF